MSDKDDGGNVTPMTASVITIEATGGEGQFVSPPGYFVVPPVGTALKDSRYVGMLYQHLPGKRDEVLRENFMRFTCPCGVVLKLHPHEFPTKDLMMPCGNPEHYAIKYEELTARPEGN